VITENNPTSYLTTVIDSQYGCFFERPTLLTCERAQFSAAQIGLLNLSKVDVVKEFWHRRFSVTSNELASAWLIP